MPNRIIKESTFTSDRIASLSDFEFRLWVGLITQADDAGLGDARPAIIKGHVFALRERVTVKDIDNALCALAAAGCVSLYTVDGKPYYAFPSWSKHQRIRDCKPKYPRPEEADLTDCRNSPQSAADCRLNPIQSESNPNKSNAHTRFTPPTVEEVKAYCEERRNGVDAQHWFDYYASNGWKVGKNAMKDWKAAVRTWEKNGFSKQKSSAQQHVAESFHAESDEEKMERLRKLTERMSGNENHD